MMVMAMVMVIYKCYIDIWILDNQEVKIQRIVSLSIFLLSLLLCSHFFVNALNLDSVPAKLTQDLTISKIYLEEGELP